jgi:hypothetical protein
MVEQAVLNESKIYPGKRDYFENLAFSHLPEMRLLIRGGKLWKKDKWRNVVEHCLVQVAVADVLSDLVGLSSEEKTTLIKVAACHDWAKRLEKRSKEFTEEEKGRAQAFLRRVSPDKKLMEATGPDFLEKFLAGKSTFLERLQCYIDDITLESDIIDFNIRLDETQKRYSKWLKVKFGGHYFDKQREFDNQISQEIFERLTSDIRKEVGEPRNIPNYLRRQIEKKWQN